MPREYQKRLITTTQIYSRVGFSHRHTPLSQEKLRYVLARHWRQFGSEVDACDFTNAQATAAIARLTGGNFRLLQCVFFQMHRVLRSDELATMIEYVVGTAASALVIGRATWRYQSCYTTIIFVVRAAIHHLQYDDALTYEWSVAPQEHQI